MRLLAAFAAVMLLSAPALARNAPARNEASIPFANNGGVDDWRADGDHTIYFKDSRNRWYRAELFGPAFDLPYVEQIGIDARPNGTLDRWGAITVKGRRYAFRSFVRVDGPPPRRNKRNHKHS